ncbi:MAG TPA: PIG-L family deacetylase [Candidatus Lokiarchaeia archaeon]|nr:PIG-L family deacetylase [Candidatus Lokiarchaeia archaeon]
MPPQLDNVLIFEAHQDDCAIGMGGTVLWLANQGYNVVLVTATKGETAYTNMDDKDRMAEIRQEEARAACEILGIDTYEELGRPCQGLVNDRETYQEIVGLIRKYQPKYIFTQNAGDSHRDHRAISTLVEEAWWKAQERVLADFGESFKADALFFYEVTNLFPNPTTIIDITPFFENKMQAVQVFKSQLDVLQGLEDYVTGVALARGYHGHCKYGEAFLASNFMPKNHF